MDRNEFQVGVSRMVPGIDTGPQRLDLPPSMATRWQSGGGNWGWLDKSRDAKRQANIPGCCVKVRRY
jgi:hypothetical protein